MAYVISVDKEKCIGCRACAIRCSNFRMRQGKAETVEPEVQDKGCNTEAAEICPVDAIAVKEK